MTAVMTDGIVALTTHARDVPSDARERFGIATAPLATDPRAICIRTCHRVELYVAGGSDVAGRDGEASLPESLELPELPPGGRRLVGSAAVRHLLSVAAGLDSVVVGEDQILHQLRDCLATRHATDRYGSELAEDGADFRDSATGARSLAPELERLFQTALRVGRETRSWREGPPRSLADVALDAAEQAGTPIGGSRVLVVGAGRMGRLIATGVARRGGRAVIANRSLERAAALAADVGGELLPPCSELDFPDVRIAAMILAISAEWKLGSAPRRRLLEAEYPVVDVSSPPSLGPDLRVSLGHRYTSIDDLARAPRDVLRERLYRRYERLLTESEAEFDRWLHARTAVPTIRRLADKAEQHRSHELEHLLVRMPDLKPAERELVEQMSRRLVATILHAPLATLNDDKTGDLERAARELFAL